MSGITLDTIDPSIHAIKISDGTDELAIAADGSIAVTDNGGSLTVDATQLDIDDLAHGTDSVAIGDGTVLFESETMDSAFSTTTVGFPILGLRRDADTSPVSADGDAHPLVFDATGKLKVEAFADQLDIDDLIHTTDSVAIGDGTSLFESETMDSAFSTTTVGFPILGLRRDADTSPVSADGDAHPLVFDDGGRLKVEADIDDVANSSVVVTTVTVDTTVGGVQLIASALASRRNLLVQNLGSENIWLKDGTGVTAGSAGNGFGIMSKSSLSMNWGPNIDLYGITASGSSTIKAVEAA